MTRNLGLATIGDQLYLSGIGNLFSQPEFVDGEHVRSGCSFTGQSRAVAAGGGAKIKRWMWFIGAENPIGRDSGVSLIISKFRSPYSDNSYIGVLGPTRQSYAKVDDS